MSYSTRVLVWRDFFDDELVLFATADEPDEEQPEAPPSSVCVLGALHLDSILDMFGFHAYNRIAKATRDESLYPVELSLRFYE
jgi:hypothetical protein